MPNPHQEFNLPTYPTYSVVKRRMWPGTYIQTTPSQKEIRVSSQQLGKWEWDLTYEYMSPVDVGWITDFYNFLSGQANAGLFRDSLSYDDVVWYDLNVAYTDGVSSIYPLYKHTSIAKGLPGSYLGSVDQVGAIMSAYDIYALAWYQVNGTAVDPPLFYFTLSDIPPTTQLGSAGDAGSNLSIVGTGIACGQPSLSLADLSYCTYFSGTAGSGLVSTFPATTFGAPINFEAFFLCSTLPPIFGTIFSLIEGGGDWRFGIAQTGQLTLESQVCTPPNVNGNRNVVDGKPHYVAAFNNGAGVTEFYIDGVLDAAVVQNITGAFTPSTAVSIGGEPPNPFAFIGYLCDVGCWGQAFDLTYYQYRTDLALAPYYRYPPNNLPLVVPFKVYLGTPTTGYMHYGFNRVYAEEAGVVGDPDIVFYNPAVPAAGQYITVSVGYMYQCRFKDNSFQIEQFANDMWSAKFSLAQVFR